MKQPFRAGDAGSVGGVEYRVERGEKTTDDLVIRIRTNGWTKPKMALSFLLADFHVQDEERLRRDGYFTRDALGGQMFLNSVRTATQAGWRYAAKRLERQRSSRREREVA